MTLAKVVIKEKIYKDGALITPPLSEISLAEAILAGTQVISVAASASDTTIPINNKGTIEALYIWTDSATTTLTVKINSSAALNASDIEFTGPVSSLTVSNSDDTNIQNLNVLVVAS